MIDKLRRILIPIAFNIEPPLKFEIIVSSCIMLISGIVIFSALHWLGFLFTSISEVLAFVAINIAVFFGTLNLKLARPVVSLLLSIIKFIDQKIYGTKYGL